MKIIDVRQFDPEPTYMIVAEWNKYVILFTVNAYGSEITALIVKGEWQTNLLTVNNPSEREREAIGMFKMNYGYDVELNRNRSLIKETFEPDKEGQLLGKRSWE